MVGIDFSTSLREIRTELVGHDIYFRCAGSNDTTWYILYIISWELEEFRGETGVSHQYPILFFYIYSTYVHNVNRESLVIVSDCDVEFLRKFPFRGPLIPNNWLKKCRLYKLSLRGSKARVSLDELFFQNIYLHSSVHVWSVSSTNGST